MVVEESLHICLLCHKSHITRINSWAYCRIDSARDLVSNPLPLVSMVRNKRCVAEAALKINGRTFLIIYDLIEVDCIGMECPRPSLQAAS